MQQIEQKNLDINEIFTQILEHKQPIFTIKSKFINIIKEHSAYTTSLQRDEITWAINNIDAIEKIVDSKKASTIIYCLFKYKECYVAEIARLIRSHTSPVRHWINKLKNKVWLIEERKSSFSNDRIFYHLNQLYPNIIGALIAVIKQRYGDVGIEKLITPDTKDGEIVDKQYELIKKIRERQVKLKTTSHIG